MPEEPHPDWYRQPDASHPLKLEFAFTASFNAAVKYLDEAQEALKAHGELPMLPMTANVIHRILVNAQLVAAMNIVSMQSRGIDCSALAKLDYRDLDRLMKQTCDLLGIRNEQIKVPLKPEGK